MVRASRRVLTVVFADLVGFTPLSERLDPEDVAAIQSAYFARAREAIIRHGGTVEKYIGDAVVGSFGVPRAHDDDAEQAVRAALAIVDGVARAGAALHLESGALQVRVGVNTGEVVITEGAGGEGWRLTGDVVNVAARLQSAASPGIVLVGADTALAVESTMLLEPLGALSLKGKSSPVTGWQVLHPRTESLRTAVLLGGETPTSGRDQEITALLRAWERAGSRPAAWLVTAPPGVGKSRLVSDLAARVSAAGGTVWATAAAPGEGSGYRSIASLLRQSLGPDAEETRVRSAVVARLTSRGASPRRAEIAAEHVHSLLSDRDLDAEPGDLYASWISTLDAHPGSTTPTWVVEDLHHADPDLLEFLAAAIHASSDRGRLVVLTSRPIAALEALQSTPGLTQLHLDPLTPAATLQMAEQLVGRGALPTAVLDRLAAASGGNPLFVEELLRAWAQSGELEEQPDGGWRFVGAATGGGVPTTVQAIYLGQLDRLPDQPRQVIHSGSIPGRTFPSSALPVLDVPGPDQALELLTGYGLLLGPHPHEVDRESYTYRHGLLREVAYGSLPRMDRARLHFRFARWLQEMGTDQLSDEAVGVHLAAACESMPRLAHELDSGHTREALAAEAGDYLEDAAARHLNSAPQRAASLLQRALDLPAEADDAPTLRRRLLLGDAQRRSGRLEDAMRTFVVAADLARDSGGVEEHVTAALGYEEALFASRLPRSRWGESGTRLLTEALASLDPAAADPAAVDLRARSMAALGRAQIYAGSLESGALTCAAAVELARDSGSQGALAYALLAARAGQTEPLQLAGRIQAVRAAAEAAHRAGDAETELEAARLQLMDGLEAGDLATADAAQSRAESLIEHLGRPLYLWYPPMWAAMRALLRGDSEQAAPLVARFREEGARWHYQDFLRVHAVQLLELCTLRGEPADVVPLLESLHPEDPHRWSPVLATALVRAHRYDEALPHFEVHAGAGFSTLPRDLSRTYLLAVLTECAHGLGDRTAAVELSAQLEPWESHAVVLGSGALCLGAVSHFAGLAAHAAGDPVRATRLLEAAVRMNDGMQASWAAASSRDLLRLVRSDAAATAQGVNR